MSENILSQFFKNLSEEVENNKLTSLQVEKLSKFMIDYKFEEELEKDEEIKTQFSYRDLLKFIALGWYIHIHILKEKILENNTTNK